MTRFEPGTSCVRSNLSAKCAIANVSFPQFVILHQMCSRLSDDGRGKFRMDAAVLPNRGEVDHGKEVDLECDEGYFR